MVRTSVFRDICLYTLIAVSAVFFIAVLAPYAIAVPRSLEHPVLSPRFLPNLLAGAVGGLALLGGLRSALQLRQLAPLQREAIRVPESAAGSLEPEGAGLRDKLRPLLAFAVLCLSYPLSGIFGMTPSSVLIVTLLLWLGRERRIWAYLAVALALPCAVAYFFEVILNVPVPAGTLLR